MEAPEDDLDPLWKELDWYVLSRPETRTCLTELRYVAYVPVG